MKTSIILAFFVGIFNLNLNAQQKSTCEQDLESGTIKIVNPNNNKWNEAGNSYQYGKFSSKIITFCCQKDTSTGKGYPTDYKIFRWDKTGIYYFNKNNHEYQYQTEKDAANAMYILNRCNIVSEIGKIAVKKY